MKKLNSERKNAKCQATIILIDKNVNIYFEIFSLLMRGEKIQCYTELVKWYE